MGEVTPAPRRRARATLGYAGRLLFIFWRFQVMAIAHELAPMRSRYCRRIPPHFPGTPPSLRLVLPRRLAPSTAHLSLP